MRELAGCSVGTVVQLTAHGQRATDSGTDRDEQCRGSTATGADHVLAVSHRAHVVVHRHR